MRRARSQNAVLGVATLVYALASLVHHWHNAEYLHSYPSMPSWLMRAGVYAAWAAVSCVGALGFLLYRRRHVGSGLVLLGLYAALGLYGLAHYAVAPPTAHSVAMNLTIGCEVTAAVALAALVAVEARRQFRVSDVSGADAPGT